MPIFLTTSMSSTSLGSSVNGWVDTRFGSLMDLATAEGGEVVPIPAGLLSGEGDGYHPISERGVPTAEDPLFGSSRCHIVDLEGTKGPAEEILTPASDIPTDPTASRGAG